MNELKETATKPKAELPIDTAHCAKAFEKWCRTHGVSPCLTPEEIWQTAWNAAINAADEEAWNKRDLWEEGDGFSLTKATAAEEIGHAIRTLISPNTNALI